VKEAGRNLWDVRTPMRDGVELSSDLYLPTGGLTGGPYPLVLVRTAENNQHPRYVEQARHLSDNGYAVALQDVRGRHDSGGSFWPFRNEGADGHDSIEWFAGQQWCTGKVGMMGAGYAAWAQWAAARTRPPHLSALASTSAWGDARQAPPYRNGLLVLPMLSWLHAVGARVWQEGGQVDWERVLWHLPLRTMDRALGRVLPVWHEWLDHPAGDAHWQELLLDVGDFAAIDLPALHVTGWHDPARPGALSFYDGMRAHSPAAADQALVVGPWDHAGTQRPTQALGGVDFGPAAKEDLDALHLRWFDRWLKGSGAGQASRLFVTGSDEWHDGDLPGADSATTYYLGAGALSPHEPVAASVDSYVYDPTDPVVLTVDLTFFPTPPAEPTQIPLDRRFVERRPDVLVYTSPELQQELQVAGRPRVHLLAGSDCPTTDFVVQLTDVSPRGSSVVVSTGVVRARFEDRHKDLTIDLDLVAHVFRPGHRLRLSVTSSLFPLYDRNLNTGDPIGEGQPRVATNQVAPTSRLVLPVVTS